MSFDPSVDPSAATPTAVAPTPDPATQDPSAAAPATPGAPAPAATPQAQPEPSWLRGRLQETRAAAVREAETRWNEERSRLQAQHEATQRQLHAIVGVTPQGDPEVNAIRAQFEKLYPGLAQLEQRAKDVQGLLERQGDYTQQTQHYWASYARQAQDRLFDHASKSLGSALTEEGKRALYSAFTGYVQSAPELLDRYAEDPTMIDEFWQNFSGAFIDPARRAAAANIETNTQHRAFPQDSPGGAPQMTPAAKPGSLDERVAGAWASYNAARNPR